MRGLERNIPISIFILLKLYLVMLLGIHPLGWAHDGWWQGHVVGCCLRWIGDWFWWIDDKYILMCYYCIPELAHETYIQTHTNTHMQISSVEKIKETYQFQSLFYRACILLLCGVCMHIDACDDEWQRHLVGCNLWLFVCWLCSNVGCALLFVAGDDDWWLMVMDWR